MTDSFSTLSSHTHARGATGLISESSDGITYMQNLDALIEEAEKDWPKLQVCFGWFGGVVVVGVW